MIETQSLHIIIYYFNAKVHKKFQTKKKITFFYTFTLFLVYLPHYVLIKNCKLTQQIKVINIIRLSRILKCRNTASTFLKNCQSYFLTIIHYHIEASSLFAKSIKKDVPSYNSNEKSEYHNTKLLLFVSVSRENIEKTQSDCNYTKYCGNKTFT